MFSFKKKTIQFQLSLNLYFQQKRTSKLSNYHLPTKRSDWVFDVTNRRNGFSNFQSYHQVVMYLFNSLVKTCTLFWKYFWTVNRNNTFELTYYKYYNTKRHSVVQFVLKSVCFLRKQILQFYNSFIFNFNHQTNKWKHFFEKGWGKFYFCKNFLKRESPTLSMEVDFQ